MKTVPVDVSMSNFQGLYTDLDPTNLPPEYLSYAVNTSWRNGYAIEKRKGITEKEWAGTGYLYDAATFPSGLYQATVLDYFAGKKRGGDNLYELVLLSGTASTHASVNQGYLYIEITNASTGALVNSQLYAYDQGGVVRNQFPTKGKIKQYLDYIFLVDGSENLLMYLNIATETNVTLSSLTLNSGHDPIFENNDAFNSLEVHTNKLWILGSLGKAYYSSTLLPLNYTADDAGQIPYKATTGLIAQNLVTSYSGLIISSANSDLNEYGSDLMTGSVPFDIDQASTQSRGYQVLSLSNDISFIPGSIQNIDNNIIGLTSAGLVDLKTLISAFNPTRSIVGGDRDISLEDTLSYPVGDIFRAMNKASSSIYSCHDPVNKRYYLSVPLEEEGDSTKYIYVYDYQYKKGIPRWSIWKMSTTPIRGLFTVKNRPFMANLKGQLFQLDTDVTLDGTERYYARMETAAVGGDTEYYLKNWPGIGVKLRCKANNLDKSFNVYAIADEWLDVKNNFDVEIKQFNLKNPLKYPATFDRYYPFSRIRTFDDDGYAAEIYFRQSSLFDSRNIKLVIEENTDSTDYVTNWEFVLAYFKGIIYSEADQGIE